MNEDRIEEFPSVNHACPNDTRFNGILMACAVDAFSNYRITAEKEEALRDLVVTLNLENPRDELIKHFKGCKPCKEEFDKQMTVDYRVSSISGEEREELQNKYKARENKK